MTTWQRRSTYGLDADTEHWHDRAACKGYDTSWWELRAGPRTAEYFRAHRICARCPVWRQCRDMAEATGSWGFIYGGKDFVGRIKFGDTPKPISEERVCPSCGASFIATKQSQVYCEKLCRARLERLRRQAERLATV